MIEEKTHKDRKSRSIKKRTAKRSGKSAYIDEDDVLLYLLGECVQLCDSRLDVPVDSPIKTTTTIRRDQLEMSSWVKK